MAEPCEPGPLPTFSGFRGVGHAVAKACGALITTAHHATWTAQADGPGMSPRTLADVGMSRRDHPRYPLWKPVCEFLDHFYESLDHEELIREEPTAVIVDDEAAYLAAIAECLSERYGLVPPRWTEKPRYFLDRAFFVDPVGPAGQAIYLAQSPAAFRRRMVFTERLPLRRKSDLKCRRLRSECESGSRANSTDRHRAALDRPQIGFAPQRPHDRRQPQAVVHRPYRRHCDLRERGQGRLLAPPVSQNLDVQYKLGVVLSHKLRQARPLGRQPTP